MTILEALHGFAPALKAATRDPRALVVWAPLARAARQACPELFSQLDALWGDTFPLSARQIEEAHARWSAEWLAWERRHDARYKLRAAAIAAALERAGDAAAPVVRARLEALEQEKLERYQRRYEDYVRVSKALAALLERDGQPRVSGTDCAG